MKKIKPIAFCVFVLVTLVVIPPRWAQHKYGTLAASDVLSYTATIISVLGTAIAGAVTIDLERKRRKAEKEEQYKRRLREILPVLSVRFRKSNSVLWIEMINQKDSPALSVHIEDQFLFSAVKHEERLKRKVEFEASANGEALLLYSMAGRLNDEGYPRKFTLYYMDVDRNTIEQEYVYDAEGTYCISGESMYL